MLKTNEAINVLKNMNEVLENIYIGLMPKSKASLLETKPAPYGIDDIVQYMYIKCVESCIIIPNGGYGINTDILWDTAFKNTIKESDEFNFLGEFSVVTNNAKLYGASSIINAKLMRDIYAREHTNKFVLLPSSVHEVLLRSVFVKPSEDDMEEYNTIVKEVNAQKVSENERLSDHAYYIEI
jgi:hypothetical protein